NGTVTGTVNPVPPAENTTPPPPTVGPQPLDITSTPRPGSPGPSDSINTTDCIQTEGPCTPGTVQFRFTIDGATFVQFTAKPSPQVGMLFVGANPDFNNCASTCVNQGQSYGINEQFWFVPADVTGTQNDGFTFVAGNSGGTSGETTVPITVGDSSGGGL